MTEDKRVYLKTKKIDIETGNELTILLNNTQAEQEGIKEGQKVMLAYGDIELYVEVQQTETKVKAGEVGIYEEIWERYRIPNGSTVVIDIFNRPDSIDYIKKKLLGQRLSKDEIYAITADIAKEKIRDIETAYFMSCFFNPGFDEEEVIDIAKGMAESGDVLDFKELRPDGGMAVDKHSIGGIAGKGVTPILVPIIASLGLTIPNTSTRAITTPAGTSDILEVAMPIAFTNDEVLKVVKKTGGCMIWGGALKLAPADDVMISVERGLHIQSYNKLVASIVAKKIAMSITHVLIDIPYGKGAKVDDAENAELLAKKFIRIFEEVGIKCQVHRRFVKGPDGNGIGPVLEMRDILWALERDDRRPKFLEKSALEMTGKLLEMSGKAADGKGYDMAESVLESGRALEKFWEIAEAQGAKKVLKADDLVPGEYSQDFKADRDGVVKFIDNKEIMRVSRALGTPFIKDAGMVLHKNVGDRVAKGDVLVSLFASGRDRLDGGIEELDLGVLFGF
ncbi:thymidine phosphorylase [Candidatus Dojkabacteria bacterium]|nr:thymidine phosphorylase [Candidatus Dojkabacteria bacterium]